MYDTSSYAVTHCCLFCHITWSNLKILLSQHLLARLLNSLQKDKGT